MLFKNSPEHLATAKQYEFLNMRRMFSLCSNMQPSLYNSTQTYIYIFEHWLNGGCLYSPYATIVDATRRVNALHSRPFNGMHPKHTRHDKILSAYSHTKSNREEYNAMQQNAARHRNSVLREKNRGRKIVWRFLSFSVAAGCRTWKRYMGPSHTSNCEAFGSARNMH